MKMVNEVSLFVMPGCSVCPHMERLFADMHKKGAIEGLQILDVTQHPELADKHNIRSVPFYLINGVAFSGLKSKQEIDRLIQQGVQQNWGELLKQELREGQLEAAEKIVLGNPPARDAMLQLLSETETELVVRIGLTAIIESLASGSLLAPYEAEFIKLAAHKDERIAVDALYYLSLLDSPAALEVLTDIAKSARPGLTEHARELLEESISNQVLH